ncbi:hypothetical protein G7Y89_g13042 [Cudoniella acicularis]|uniref:Uncharacterized protein n=1 Tax=Cudoniella acicularis TaxID=354080 RepID=A0A8H4R842_9HELO|nr:hypothetical protein G7Y89_g13042 [Cudoniella acicularis]
MTPQPFLCSASTGSRQDRGSSSITSPRASLSLGTWAELVLSNIDLRLQVEYFPGLIEFTDTGSRLRLHDNEDILGTIDLFDAGCETTINDSRSNYFPEQSNTILPQVNYATFRILDGHISREKQFVFLRALHWSTLSAICLIVDDTYGTTSRSPPLLQVMPPRQVKRLRVSSPVLGAGPRKGQNHSAQLHHTFTTMTPHFQLDSGENVSFATPGNSDRGETLCGLNGTDSTASWPFLDLTLPFDYLDPFREPDHTVSILQTGYQPSSPHIPELSHLNCTCTTQPNASLPNPSESLSERTIDNEISWKVLGSYPSSSSSYPDSGYATANVTPQSQQLDGDFALLNVPSTPWSYSDTETHNSHTSVQRALDTEEYQYGLEDFPLRFENSSHSLNSTPVATRKRKRNSNDLELPLPELWLPHPSETSPVKTSRLCHEDPKSDDLPQGSITLTPANICALFLELVRKVATQAAPVTADKSQPSNEKDETTAKLYGIPEALKTDEVSKLLSQIPNFDQQRSRPVSQGSGVPQQVRQPAQESTRPERHSQPKPARYGASEDNSETSDSAESDHGGEIDSDNEPDSDEDEDHDNKAPTPNDDGLEDACQPNLLNLLEACKSQVQSCVQHSPNGGSSNNSSTSSTTTSISATTPSSVANSSAPNQNATTETQSPNETNVAVDNGKSQAKLVSRPFPLICWHAANGIRCNGKTGYSPEVRRLLKDHSLSEKSSNTHKLPPPCPRCKRLFEDPDSAKEHEKLLQSDPSCPILSAEALYSANHEIDHKGISEDRRKKVMQALENLRTKNKLPVDYKRAFFDEWINNNATLYINQSDKTFKDAQRELGKWLVVFCTLFPGEKVPPTPFVDRSEGTTEYDRVLELIRDGLAKRTSQRVLPDFDHNQLAAIQEVVMESLERRHLELLQEKASAQQPKTPKKPSAKRQRDEEDSPTSQPSAQSMVAATPDSSTGQPSAQTMLPPTPTPVQPNLPFAPLSNHPAATTFNQPSPGVSMGPPASPVYSEAQTPGAPMRYFNHGSGNPYLTMTPSSRYDVEGQQFMTTPQASGQPANPLLDSFGATPNSFDSMPNSSQNRQIGYSGYPEGNEFSADGMEILEDYMQDP